MTVEGSMPPAPKDAKTSAPPPDPMAVRVGRILRRDEEIYLGGFEDDITFVQTPQPDEPARERGKPITDPGDLEVIDLLRHRMRTRHKLAIPDDAITVEERDGKKYLIVTTDAISEVVEEAPSSRATEILRTLGEPATSRAEEIEEPEEPLEEAGELLEDQEGSERQTSVRRPVTTGQTRHGKPKRGRPPSQDTRRIRELVEQGLSTTEIAQITHLPIDKISRIRTHWLRIKGIEPPPRVIPERAKSTTRERTTAPETPTLTNREREVLNLLAHGLTSDEISQYLQTFDPELRAHAIIQRINKQLNLPVTTGHIRTIVKSLDLGFVDQDAQNSIMRGIDERQLHELTEGQKKVLDYLISDQYTGINNDFVTHVASEKAVITTRLALIQEKFNIHDVSSPLERIAAIWKIHRMRQLTQPSLAVETTTPASEYETRPDLSAQQLEALKLKAKGYTDIQIGNSMPSAQGLSNKESHARKLLTGAYQELGTKSSIIAIIKAMDLGYITSDDVLSDDERTELRSRYVQLKPTHTALLDILTTDDETKKTYKDLVGKDPRFTSVAIIRRIASSAQTTLHTNDIYHTAVVYAIAKKLYGNIPEHEAQPSSPLDSITPRQKQIINLMLQGYNEDQIAGRLVLSDGDTERQFSKRTIGEENAKIRKALGIRGGSGDNLALHTILTLIDLDTQGTVIDPTLVIQNMDLANLQKLSQEQLPQDVQRVLSELIRDNGAESTNEQIRDRTGIALGTIKNYFYRLPFATKLQAAVYWKMKDDPRLLEAINDRLHPELSDHNE